MLGKIYLLYLIFFLFGYWVLPLLFQRFYRLRLKAICRYRRTLTLTFDDGPGSHFTPVILELLRKHGIKATFFVLGRNITGREDIVRQIIQEGHEVGIHGFAHLHAWKKWPWQTIKDIQRGREALEGVVVSDNIKYLFRPPYGKLNLATLVYLWIERLPICYWTLDSKDTWSEDRRRKRKDWIKPLAKNGGVILLHDFDRRSDAESTLLYMTETVQTCVAIARQSKLKFCIMSELRQKTSPKTLKI